MLPVELSAHGFGETAVALAFGALPVAGAAWWQSGIVDIDVLLASVSFSLWVATILLIDEVPVWAWRKTKLQPEAHHALLSKSLFASWRWGF